MLLTEQAQVGQQLTKLEKIQTELVPFPDMSQILLPVLIAQPCRRSQVILDFYDFHVAFKTNLPVSFVHLVSAPFVHTASSSKHKYLLLDFL